MNGGLKWLENDLRPPTPAFSMRSSLLGKALLFGILCLCAATWFWGSHSTSSTRGSKVSQDAHPVQEIGPTTPAPRSYRYRRGILNPSFTLESRPSLSYIEESVLIEMPSLTEDLGLVPLTDDDYIRAKITEVEVRPDPVDSGTGHLLFGVATEVERIEARFTSLQHFMGGSNASLLAAVSPDKDLKVREEEFRSRGLDITLVASKLPFTQRYFSLVRLLDEHVNQRRSQTYWVGLIDDDTIFSSMQLLCKRLASLPHGQYYYIGALSEADWQVTRFGHIAFGGAGIFLSITLLDWLNEFYPYCSSKRLGPLDMPGDGRLAECIYKLDPALRLTIWSELRQWDLHGNPDGIFEAGKPIWSFHHFESSSWMSRDVRKMAMVSAVSGEQSILQRWIFETNVTAPDKRTEFFLLTNGYSVVQYTIEPGIPDIDFNKTEYTWAEDMPGYAKALGPFRPRDVDGITKKTWLLQNAVYVGNNLHQLYEHSNAEEKDVIEIIWLGGKGSNGNTHKEMKG